MSEQRRTTTIQPDRDDLTLTASSLGPISTVTIGPHPDDPNVFLLRNYGVDADVWRCGMPQPCDPVPAWVRKGRRR